MTTRRSTLLASLTLALLPAAAAAQHVAPRTPLDAEVTAVYRRFVEGLQRRDTIAYRDLLLPNIIHVTGDSATASFGRADRLRFDRSDTTRTVEFTADGCRVERYERAAVGPCWFTQRAIRNDSSFTWPGVSLVTFVQGADGRWRIAATRPSLAGRRPH